MPYVLSLSMHGFMIIPKIRILHSHKEQWPKWFFSFFFWKTNNNLVNGTTTIGIGLFVCYLCIWHTAYAERRKRWIEKKKNKNNYFVAFVNVFFAMDRMGWIVDGWWGLKWFLYGKFMTIFLLWLAFTKPNNVIFIWIFRQLIELLPSIVFAIVGLIMPLFPFFFLLLSGSRINCYSKESRMAARALFNRKQYMMRICVYVCDLC